ncbi:MAG: DUF11 domain-containing protein [Verrucomicrobia bacterium]|nr:DUF11 domain-containing protein [Verrucomicrobiota bacterium]
MLCACSAAGLEPPFAPNPPSAAANSLAEGELSWAAGGSNLIINGDFEAGTLTGWRKESPTGKDFILNKGAYDPPGSDPVQPVFSGTVSVVATTGAPGAQALVQDLTIPPTATSAVLSWADRIRNYAPLFSHPNQEFRVEIRDPDGSVRAELFSTKPGDPLLQDWTRRSADVSAFIGQTIRVAFVEADDLGLFNVHLDEIRLEVSSLGTTEFDVYLGTNPTPGPAELLGTTDRLTWHVSGLLPETTYSWQVVARAGGQSASSPVWQFKVGPRGPLAGFRWAPLVSPQYRGLPFPVAVRAADEFRHSVADFGAAVNFAGLAEKTRPAAVLISEVITGAGDQVEFLNFSDATVDISNWKVTIYDVSTWPVPRFTFVIPPDNIVRAGRFFFVRMVAQPPTQGPSFAAGQEVAWGNTPANGLAAVLLQDAADAIVDFVSIHGALPGDISAPVPIPVGEWFGPPLPLSRDATFSYQRVGNSDRQNAADWVSAPLSLARVNAGCAAHFVPGLGMVGVTPERATDFAGGLWQGSLAVQATSEAVVLVADDGRGHTGQSAPLRVEDEPPIFMDLPEQAVEGAGVLSQAGTVRLLRPWTTSVVVTLKSSDPTAASVPASVTIPAGQTRVGFDLTVADDAVLDGTQTITISGSAPGFAVAPSALAVHDNETTTVSLGLPTETVEGGGTLSGTVTLAVAPAREVRVLLTASDPTQLELPEAVLVDAGQTSAAFSLSGVDDPRIDGDVTVTVAAAVANWTAGSASILVRDNEHRRLQLSLPVSLSENAGPRLGGGQLTIAGTLPQALLVTLSSAPLGELGLPATIAIPAGSTTVKFDVAPTVEADFRALQVVTVTATAPGFESAQAMLELRDESLRLLDLVVSDLAYDPLAKRLYASVPARALNLANKIVVIDPLTGTIERDISVGSDPGLLALSDDGQVLYVGLNGDLAVQRIKLDTHTPEPPVSLDGYQAVGLVVPAGQSERVLVNRLKPGLGMPIEHGLNVSLYVNGQRQPENVEVFGNVPLGLLRTEIPDKAFITIPNLTELGLRDTGVFVRRSSPEPARQRHWTYDRGFLFSGDGLIVEAATFNPLGSIPVPGFRRPESGLVAADLARSRLFYLADPVFGESIGNLQLTEADPLTRTLGSSRLFKYTSSFGGLIRWGEDGLAFSIDNKLHLLRTALVPTGPPVDLRVTKSYSPQPVVVGTDLTCSLVVSNGGPASATSVALTDILPFGPKWPLPAPVQLVSARSSQGVCTNVTLIDGQPWAVCDLGVLATGATATVTLVMKPQLAGLWTNAAVVRSAQIDLNPADNTAVVPLPVQIPDRSDSIHKAIVKTSDLIYTPSSQRLFASVPADASQFPNSLLRINPANLEIEAAFPIGANPNKLAVSSDGQFLYVALDQAAAIRRFDLARQTPGPEFRTGVDPAAGQFVIGDLEVLPNQPEVLAATIRNEQPWNPSSTLVIFDHGVRREQTQAAGSFIEIAPDGTAIYSQQGSWHPPFQRFNVGPGGVSLQDATPEVFASEEFRLASGLIYAASGDIVDPVTVQRVGRFEGIDVPGWVVPALEHGRVFFLSPPEGKVTWQLRAYDRQTHREVGAVQIGGIYSPTSFVRCGPDRFAFRALNDQLFIVRTSLLPTGPGTDLELGLALAVQSVIRGRDVELHLTIRNRGSAAADRLEAELPLPAGFGFRSAVTAGLNVTESLGLITASMASLAAGAAAEARIVVQPSEAGWFVAPARLRSRALETDSRNNFVDVPFQVQHTTALGENTRFRLPSADLVGDPSGRVLYASVPGSSAGPVLGDCIVAIDPATAAIKASKPVGREPGRLALSPAGQRLYVALDGQNRVLTIDVPAWAAGPQVDIGPGRAVEDLAGFPDDLGSFVFVREGLAFVWRGQQVQKIDLEPNGPIQFRFAQRVGFASDGRSLYVQSTSSSFGAAFHVFEIGAADLTPLRLVENCCTGADFDVVGDRIYAGAGPVVNTTDFSVLHIFPVDGVGEEEVAPEPQLDRVYYLHSLSSTPKLTAFDFATQQQIASSYIPGFVGLAAPNRFTRWGADGFAFRTPTHLYLLRDGVVPLPPGQDFDQDGLPDDWEREHQFNPNLASDAAEDADGDGLSNHGEFVAGTAPRNANSVLRITSLKRGAQGLLLAVATIGGKRYRLEANQELSAARWNAVGEVFDGTGGLLEAPLPAPDSVAQFYRVRIVQ